MNTGTLESSVGQVIRVTLNCELNEAFLSRLFVPCLWTIHEDDEEEETKSAIYTKTTKRKSGRDEERDMR